MVMVMLLDENGKWTERSQTTHKLDSRQGSQWHKWSSPVFNASCFRIYDVIARICTQALTLAIVASSQHFYRFKLWQSYGMHVASGKNACAKECS
jgi:hypothetical protein